MLIAALTTVNAFNPSFIRNIRNGNPVTRMVKDYSDKSENLKNNFASFTAVIATAFAINVGVADAAFTPQFLATTSFDSSSIEIADAVKTLDFSMPSYGEIKDPTKTIIGVEIQKDEETRERKKAESKSKFQSQTKPEKAEKDSSGVTVNMFSKSKSQEAEKADKIAAKERKLAAKAKADAEAEAKKNEKIEIVDMALPSYSDSAVTPGKKGAFSL
eukprot:CAMPEP_0195530902 /NCGR_PEP_ID=MMETSP0794_2-20130614/34022_1 /TAXON_ID=515487 /ORGANISM="Stephanopyxis turris, Strain CCMP 815" /LENGTH=215 /DNA_ID=CAMNT_0040662523 /DNA_START=138 /DNA_END=785 /DNA_ORIENTATION=-